VATCATAKLGRFEVRHVPADVLERDRVMGHTRTPVLKKYERICFDREQRTVYGKPTADLVHPGHPLMAAVTDLVLSSHRSLLKRGAVLVDPNDDSTEPKVLFMLDHSVRETAAPTATAAIAGQPKDVSRRLQFVEMGPDGQATPAPFARHLDLLPITTGQTSWWPMCCKPIGSPTTSKRAHWPMPWNTWYPATRKKWPAVASARPTSSLPPCASAWSKKFNTGQTAPSGSTWTCAQANNPACNPTTPAAVPKNSAPA
jgi:hypothetical protein